MSYRSEGKFNLGEATLAKIYRQWSQACVLHPLLVVSCSCLSILCLLLWTIQPSEKVLCFMDPSSFHLVLLIYLLIDLQELWLLFRTASALLGQS